MTYEKPILCDDPDKVSFRIGDLGTLSLQGGSFLSLDQIPITDARLQTAWKHALYRLRIAAARQEITLHLS